jgi:hypothetical protein
MAAIENAPDGVRHGLVVIVTVHQHAENAGDGALLGARPRAQAGAAAP